MTGRVVLDTNIVIALFANEEQVLTEVAAADQILVPAIVLGELYFGARKSGRSAKNVSRVRTLASTAKVLNTDAGTADAYGRIRHALLKKGRPIPENDVWIAALAIQHRMPLATRDEHFAAVEGLYVLRW